PRSWLMPPETIYWSPLVRLTEDASDSDCWDALAAAGKTVDVNSRLDLIFLVCEQRPRVPKDLQRQARIRFLLRYFDDKTQEICAAWDGVEVRDHAASRLASLLRIAIESPEGQCNHPGETRGPFYRLVIRAIVREAAVRELGEAK
ncbi:MAG TPA: hypothetical protein VGL71_00715, partial [Urbifossiella sp.]